MVGKSPEEWLDQDVLVEDEAELRGGSRALPVALCRGHAACARGGPGLSSRLP
jgi:hypothetical protein